MSAPVYSIAPGRTILKDGHPFFMLVLVDHNRAGWNEGRGPTELDDLARALPALLNSSTEIAGSTDMLNEARDCLRDVVQHMVWDEEGDLTRPEFDALYARAERLRSAGSTTERPKDEAAHLRELVERIRDELDGVEYDASTASNIGAILTEAGYEIRDPEDMVDNDEDEEEDPTLQDRLNR